MASAVITDLGAEVEPPPFSATASVDGMEVFVDMEELIDVAAEISRNENEVARLRKAIASKQKKLGNPSFTSRAPADVVAREKESLEHLQSQVNFHTSMLEKLESR